MNGENKKRLSVYEMAVFAALGAVMFCSKLVMEVLPNVHLLGVLTIAYTLAFRKKALIPIYIYVLLNGLYAGFSVWWLPYLYIWAILWGVTMLLPKKLPKKAALIVCPLLCSLHGLAFGVLYAPAHAVLFGLNLRQTAAWIAAGAPWDIVHAVGNFCVGLLIVPIAELLGKLNKKFYT